MKRHLLYLLPFTVFCLSSCAQHDDKPANTELNSDYTFNAVGYAPIEAQSGNTFDSKMLNAIKASKLEAYKEMAEQIYGVLVTADNAVENAILLDDILQTTVKGLVRGAHVSKSYHEGDVYITELELDIKTLPYAKASEFNQQDTRVIKVEEAVYY